MACSLVPMEDILRRTGEEDGFLADERDGLRPLPARKLLRRRRPQKDAAWMGTVLASKKG